ncbi:hypothetical protein HT031_003108 [Scenedesmus sp. PABB004]|nr:hypothetical protein HT031_003108 [Scenedesmus sp. PABB004]
MAGTEEAEEQVPQQAGAAEPAELGSATEEDTETDEGATEEEDVSEGGEGGKKKKKKKKVRAAAGPGASGAAAAPAARAWGALTPRRRVLQKKKKKAGASGEPGSSSDEAGSGQQAPAGASQQEKQEKQEAERRFQKALEAAKHSEDMWVLLGNANIHDAKARKLFDALRANASITSVNLSANHIGDEGVQALVDVLQDGGCAELINLDLRGNELSEQAQSLLRELRKKRRQLVIEVGPLPDENAEASSSGAGPGAGGKHGARGRGAARGAAKGAAAGAGGPAAEKQWDGQSLKELAKHSPMFRRYFQTEEEEGAAGSSSSDGEPEGAEALPPPQELWDQVLALLPVGLAAIPQLSEALLAVSRALDAEMANMPAPEERAQLPNFRPHHQAVLQHLGLLQQVLALTPQPQLTQSSASEAQCRAVEMLRCSLQSSVHELWRGLFLPGFGCGLAQRGGEPLPPLHDELIRLASAAGKQAMGQRPCVMGFVAEVANALLQASDAAAPDYYCAELAALLAGSDAWQRSTEPSGALHALLAEQDGQLCGPPPPRPAQSVDEEESADQGLGIINGSQLMALLSRMGDLTT